MTHRDVVAVEDAHAGVGGALHLDVVEHVVAAVVHAQHVVPRPEQPPVHHLCGRVSAEGLSPVPVAPGPAHS